MVRQIFLRQGLEAPRCKLSSDDGPMGLNVFLQRGHLYISESVLSILTPDEFEAVISHEASHQLQGHLRSRAIFYFLSFFVFFGLVPVMILSLHFEHFRTSLTVALCVLNFITFFTVNFALFRNQEYEADGLAVQKFGASRADLISALRKLSAVARTRAGIEHESSVLSGSMMESVVTWFRTHPPLPSRFQYLSLVGFSPRSIRFSPVIRKFYAAVLVLGFLALGKVFLFSRSLAMLNRLKQNDIAAVEQALQHGLSPNELVPFQGRTTLLGAAILMGRDEIVRVLVANGASLTAANWVFVGQELVEKTNEVLLREPLPSTLQKRGLASESMAQPKH